jgi:glutathione synthase/RimK-type ligase-like ATP-grasp enzyme
VVTPRIATLPRAALERSGAAALALRGFTFPLLLRSPGYQTGRHFVRVESPGALAAAVRELPGESLLALEFIDVRGDDGALRKYRMMLVGGTLYPMHAAISRAWKVHYVTAEMDDPLNRADDDAFLRDPEAVIGTRAMAAVERIRDTLGLEYAGVDFSLDRAGNVVAFEANATMIVLPPAADAIWDYRRAPVARVIDAVQKLVRSSRAPT